MAELYEINCPHCDRPYRLTRQKLLRHAGRTTTCKSCDEQFVIPELPEAERESGDEHVERAGAGEGDAADAATLFTTASNDPVVPTSITTAEDPDAVAMPDEPEARDEPEPQDAEIVAESAAEPEPVVEVKPPTPKPRPSPQPRPAPQRSAEPGESPAAPSPRRRARQERLVPPEYPAPAASSGASLSQPTLFALPPQTVDDLHALRWWVGVYGTIGVLLTLLGLAGVAWWLLSSYGVIATPFPPRTAPPPPAQTVQAAPASEVRIEVVPVQAVPYPLPLGARRE